MKTFTIDTENNITVHGSAKQAGLIANSARFTSETALAKLAVNWPAFRLVEIYNSLPGATEVRKFKDRATAVSRIWKALQAFAESVPATEEAQSKPASEATVTAEKQPAAIPLPETLPPTSSCDAHVGAQSPDVAPDRAPAKHKATGEEEAPNAAEGGPRRGSKTSQVIAMLKRDGGATLEEIMTAMGWLKHTTRAMLSAGGSLTKDHGLTIISEKVGDHRRYSIKA